MIKRLIPRLLNKEVDESLVKENEFIDAVNVKIDGAGGTDAGIIKFADGNEKIVFNDDANLSNLQSSSYETIVGVCEDEKDETIYVFAAGTSKDSVYMVSRVGTEYKMTLLARSASLDLDPDNFVASDIIRIYNTKIDTSGVDGGSGGFFDDGVEITDFPDETIIEPEDPVASSGTASIIVNGELSVQSETAILNPGVSNNAAFANSSFFIQNIGDAVANVTINADISVTTAGATSSVTLAGAPEGTAFAMAPGSSKVVTVIPAAAYVDAGDAATISVYFSSNAEGFIPLQFEATTTFAENEILDPVISYLPNPSISHEDFFPVPIGQSSTQSKSYSIINSTPILEGVSSPSISGTISIITSSLEVDDATYLKNVDLQTGVTTEAETLTFSVEPGGQYDFQLIMSVNGLEDAFIGTAQVKIEYDPDLEFGTGTPTEITSPGMFVQVEEEITFGDPEPYFTAINIEGWQGTIIETEPLNLTPSANLDGTSTGLTYYNTIRETLGLSGGNVTVQLVGNWENGFSFGDYASLFDFGVVSPGIGFGGSTGNITPLPQAQFHSIDISAGGSASFFMNLRYVASNFDPLVDQFVDSVNSFESDVIFNGVLIFQYTASNGSVIDILYDEFQIKFGQQQSAGFLSVQVIGGFIQGADTTLNGGSQSFNLKSTTSGSPASGSGVSLSDLNVGSSVYIKASHNGTGTLPVPSIKMTNTYVNSDFGDEFYIASQASSTYLANSNYNADWSTARNYWCGEGNFPNGLISSGTGPFFYGQNISDIGSFGWRIAGLGYFGDSYSLATSGNGLFYAGTGVFTNNTNGCWANTNPQTGFSWGSTGAFLDPSFTSLDSGFADENPVDGMTWKEVNVTSMASSLGAGNVTVYSPWFIDESFTGSAGSAPTDPIGTWTIGPGQEVWTCITGTSPSYGDMYAGVTITAGSQYINQFNTFKVALVKNLGSAASPPPPTPKDNKSIQGETTEEGSSYSLTSTSSDYTPPPKSVTKSTTSPMSTDSALKKAGKKPFKKNR